MENLISVDELVKKAKTEGIKFGNIDPYNRLRYYTKIGWLPHMIRKKDKKGNITGHYPQWALKALKEIEKMRDMGLSNKEITQKIKKTSKVESISNLINIKELKKQGVTYLILASLVIILLVELDIIPVNKQRKFITPISLTETPTYIISSGVSFIPKGEENTFVETRMIDSTSKVYISFRSDYSPATRYWVENIQDGKGFTLKVNSPTISDSEFYWWISK